MCYVFILHLLFMFLIHDLVKVLKNKIWLLHKWLRNKSYETKSHLEYILNDKLWVLRNHLRTSLKIFIDFYGTPLQNEHTYLFLFTQLSKIYFEYRNKIFCETPLLLGKNKLLWSDVYL